MIGQLRDYVSDQERFPAVDFRWPFPLFVERPLYYESWHDLYGG